MGSYGALYYRQIVGAGSTNGHLPAVYWSYTSAASMALGSFISPLVGAICDAKGKRKLVFNLAMGVCYITTMMFLLPGLGAVHSEGTVLWASTFVALSSVAYMVA